jgi:hypothetical protein
MYLMVCVIGKGGASAAANGAKNAATKARAGMTLEVRLALAQSHQSHSSLT